MKSEEFLSFKIKTLSKGQRKASSLEGEEA
jgi:hypothetical protein